MNFYDCNKYRNFYNFNLFILFGLCLKIIMGFALLFKSTGWDIHYTFVCIIVCSALTSLYEHIIKQIIFLIEEISFVHENIMRFTYHFQLYYNKQQTKRTTIYNWNNQMLILILFNGQTFEQCIKTIFSNLFCALVQFHFKYT